MTNEKGRNNEKGLKEKLLPGNDDKEKWFFYNLTEFHKFTNL